MLLEIAILSYNRPIQLERALLSLPRMPTHQVTYTVYDDNSPLRSEIASIIKKYACIHPNLFFCQRDSNLGYDLNLYNSLTKSNAKYVFLLSDDDFLVDDCLIEVYNFLRSAELSLYIFPYLCDSSWYRLYQPGAEPAGIASFIYNTILFSGLCFKVSDLQCVPKVKLLFASVFIQVYLGCYCFANRGFSYVNIKAVELGGDGKNFFGLSSALPDSSLSVRGNSLSDFRYQQRLVSVIKMVDQFIYPSAFVLFAKEYNRRLIALVLRCRSENDMAGYFVASSQFHGLPLWMRLLRLIVSLVPRSCALSLYCYARTFRRSG